ncbi:hypothetical protein EYC84_008512 [Monilinia fructicola]|uniref:Uncharacterized protein n=1 Tax=Monilinia fructicola TaxID=38448 RepID=A0A5M9JH87_MONFR|nr:hypothetical protein EYC84_008512 [Monilinia fructicola]
MHHHRTLPNYKTHQPIQTAQARTFQALSEYCASHTPLIFRGTKLPRICGSGIAAKLLTGLAHYRYRVGKDGLITTWRRLFLTATCGILGDLEFLISPLEK